MTLSLRAESRRRSRRRRKTVARSIRFEPLEPRRLLAADILLFGGSQDMNAEGELALSDAPPSTFEEAGLMVSYGTAANGLPLFSSNPSAAAKVFLDFDGHFEPQWGSYSNITTPVWSLDSDTTTFNSTEAGRIEAIWRQVAEDFAPFNLDVTTIEPESFANREGLRVAIGGDSSWFGSQVSGLAYRQTWTNSIVNTVYVFPSNLSNNAKPIAEVASHEVGHAFGLYHQSRYDSNGNKTHEYHPGSGDWAPIMGNGLSKARTTWHNGTSISSTIQQDDLAVISNSFNGFGYRDDDHGGLENPTQLVLDTSGKAQAVGVIEQMDDSDAFRFQLTEDSTGSFQVDVFNAYPNLKATLELRTEQGTLLAAAGPNSTYGASLTQTLTAGNYVLVVQNDGVYGSLGHYTVKIDFDSPSDIPDSPDPPPVTGEVINFHDYSIDTFGGGSVDGPGSAEILDNGATLYLTGNSWKKLDFSYRTTPDTILEFDFWSTQQGDTHGIGFSRTLSLAANRTFKLYGTENWGRTNFDTYARFAPNIARYVIPVGQFFTQNFSYLFFANAHGVENPTAVSYFSNVRVYELGQESEDTPESPSPDVDAVDDQFTVNQMSADNVLNVLANDTVSDGANEFLQIAHVSTPSAGGVVEIVNGTVLRYTPEPSFFGNESLTYTLVDTRTAIESQATVVIDVTRVILPPTASDVELQVTTGSDWVLIDVLAHAEPHPHAGESLTLVGLGAPTAGGQVEIVSDTQIRYRPDPAFEGLESFTYTVNDGLEGNDATATVLVAVTPPVSANYINFLEYSIGPFGGGSVDGPGSAKILDDGATLNLTGNSWKKIDFSYTTTPDTILEFDFWSTQQGDTHGIGFARTLSLAPNRAFKLYGTENWGRANFDTYAQFAPGVVRYMIPVGQFFTQNFSYLFFANAHGVENPTAESFFSNIRVYEKDSQSLSGALPQVTGFGTNDKNENSHTASQGLIRNDNASLERVAFPASPHAASEGNLAASRNDFYFNQLGAAGKSSPLGALELSLDWLLK